MYAKHFTLTLAAVLCGLGVALPVYAEPIVLNPSFEANDTAGYGEIDDWPAYPADAGWGSPDSGTSDKEGGSFYNNGATPDGNFVAFLEAYDERDGNPISISQEISGFEVGQLYEVNFFVNSRNWGDRFPDLKVYIDSDLKLEERIYPVDDADRYDLPFHERSFELTATSVSHTLKFEAHCGTSNDDTVLLDNVSVTLVPEPSTLALLAVGAVGLLLFGRRRRR